MKHCRLCNHLIWPWQSYNIQGAHLTCHEVFKKGHIAGRSIGYEEGYRSCMHRCVESLFQAVDENGEGVYSISCFERLPEKEFAPESSLDELIMNVVKKKAP